MFLKKLFFVIVIIELLTVHEGFAQQQYYRSLKKGEAVPNINLTIHRGDQIRQVSLNDFKGKLVLLNYWGVTCAGCVAGMPEILQLQNQFKNKIEIIEVTGDKASDVTELWKRIHGHVADKVWRAGQNLDFIEEDTVISKMFPHDGYGYNVWIDENRNYMGTSHEESLSANYITSMLNKKNSSYTELDIRHNSIDLNNPLLLLKNSTGYDSTYYSFITFRNQFGGWTGDQNVLIDSVTNITHGLVYTNKTILDLYEDALSKAYQIQVIKVGGDINRMIILAVENRDKFIDPKSKTIIFDPWSMNNTYCYAINLPLRDAGNIYGKMIESLNNYFGLKVEKENKVIKCLVLRRTSKEDFIRTKRGSKFLFDINYDGPADTIGKMVYLNHEFKFFFNQSIEEMVRDNHVKDLHGYLTLTPPVIDETGYKNNVDIVLPNWRHGTTIESMNKSLKKIGLGLFEVRRKVPVIIIEDSTHKIQH